MAYQTVFKRYEIKYLITGEQRERLLEVMEPYMAMDKYGYSTIRNIYFDTDTYRLARRSLEKPMYKEKLRARSYRQASEDTPIFIEIKKKYDSVVYKRRVILPEKEAMDWLCFSGSHPAHDQICNEIDYFCSFYGPLYPKVFLSYDRAAYYSRSGDEFRLTLDENIRYRPEELSLCAEPYGTALLRDDDVLMEIKTHGSIPLWLVRFLSENRIYKSSFSKYGMAYINMIENNEIRGYNYA